MEIDGFPCNTCGEEKTRLRLEGTNPCYGDMCCDCCKNKGLQTENCTLVSLELELIKQGKKLNLNERGVFGAGNKHHLEQIKCSSQTYPIQTLLLKLSR